MNRPAEGEASIMTGGGVAVAAGTPGLGIAKGSHGEQAEPRPRKHRKNAIGIDTSRNHGLEQVMLKALKTIQRSFVFRNWIVISFPGIVKFLVELA